MPRREAGGQCFELPQTPGLAQYLCHGYTVEDFIKPYDIDPGLDPRGLPAEVRR